MPVLNEKPNAEPLPQSSGAAIQQNGRYLPPPADDDGKIWVRTTALVQQEPETLYAMWRNLSSVPAWQEQITSVVETGERTSHWTMQVDGKAISWTSEILADEPGKRIAWHTTEGDLEEAGEVIFEPAPDERGTYVIVLMQFRMSKIANALQSVKNRGSKQGVIENLRHFKALAETGEIPRSQPGPHGKRGIVGDMKRSLYGENIPAPTG